MRLGLATSGFVCALAGLALLACATPATPPPPEPAPAASIEIVPPPEPLSFPVVVRKGSFQRSHANADGIALAFLRTLESARVFTAVLGSAPADGSPRLAVVLAAADYGEPNAYTFELQALLVRGTEPLVQYETRQSLRQSGGQLTVGPSELARLADRAIRDVVRQIAADSERIAAL